MKTVLNEFNVLKVYSGRPGCMCGCQGKYWSSSMSARKALLDEHEVVNDRQVRRIVKILNESEETKIDEGCAFVELNNRSYVAYLSEVQS